MKNKLELPIGDKKLVVWINDWQDNMPKDICVYVEDNNGVIIQDICVVREHYHFNPKKECFEIDSNMIDCMVWSDNDNEDYTHKFTIGVVNEEEE